MSCEFDQLSDRYLLQSHTRIRRRTISSAKWSRTLAPPCRYDPQQPSSRAPRRLALYRHSGNVGHARVYRGMRVCVPDRGPRMKPGACSPTFLIGPLFFCCCCKALPALIRPENFLVGRENLTYQLLVCLICLISLATVRGSATGALNHW